MAFQLEKISDEDKAKYGFDFSIRRWAVDRERDAYVVFIRGYGQGEYSVFDLYWKGVIIRAGMEQQFRIGEAPPYNGTYTVRKIYYPKQAEENLQDYKDLMTDALKLIGYFGNPDKGGDVTVIWPEALQAIPCEDVQSRRGI